MLENTKRSASRANHSRMAMSPMNSSSLAMTSTSGMDFQSPGGQHMADILSLAKKDVKKMKKKIRHHKISQRWVVQLVGSPWKPSIAYIGISHTWYWRC